MGRISAQTIATANRFLIFAGLLVASLASSAELRAYTLKTLYPFCSQANCTDGQAPYGDLTMDAAGNIYGSTADGGDRGQGVVFELVYDPEHQTWDYQRLYSFCQGNCDDGGGSPTGHLAVDVAGNLYGVTRFGGTGGSGTIFELTKRKHGWRLLTLHNLCSEPNCADGDEPLAGLTYQNAAAGSPYDGTSPLFGVTQNGGSSNNGVVFEIVHKKKNRWRETVVYNFCSAPNCADGAFPEWPLFVSNAGELFGTTGFGGAKSDGIIFDLRPKGKAWKEDVLYSFCSLSNCADGKEPNELVMDANGNILGANGFGGASTGGYAKEGTVFRFVPDGAQYSVLYNFCSESNCADGANPEAGLSVDSSGNIFGTTMNGGGPNDLFGIGGGVVFELSGGVYQVLYSFCSLTNCTDGGYPYSNLIIDKSGNLFGVAEIGGEHLGGTVFELTP